MAAQQQMFLLKMCNIFNNKSVHFVIYNKNSALVLKENTVSRTSCVHFENSLNKIKMCS